jgi:hypothetical protein
MRQRHPRPPAERAERAGGVGADEFEEFEGHTVILREWCRSNKSDRAIGDRVSFVKQQIQQPRQTPLIFRSTYASSGSMIC